MTVEYRTETGSTSLKEIWETKDQWFSLVKESQATFDALPTEQQEALYGLVETALTRMRQRVPDWVPESLIPVKGGDYLDVHLRILFTDIDAAIDRGDERVCTCGCHDDE